MNTTNLQKSCMSWPNVTEHIAVMLAVIIRVCYFVVLSNKLFTFSFSVSHFFPLYFVQFGHLGQTCISIQLEYKTEEKELKMPV